MTLFPMLMFDAFIWVNSFHDSRSQYLAPLFQDSLLRWTQIANLLNTGLNNVGLLHAKPGPVV